MKTPIALTSILQKPMDRRDFLKHIGVAILFAAGGGMIMNSIGGMKKLGLDSSQGSKYGYGGSVYGGHKLG